MNPKPDKFIQQNAEKIYNIERIENANVDISHLIDTLDKLKEAVERFPELLSSTIMRLPDTSNTIIEMWNRTQASMSSHNQYDEELGTGDIVMSHWQIDRCIGKGSFSTVYEAHHTDHLFKSAIKVIHPTVQYINIFRTDVTHRIYHTSELVYRELENMAKLRGNGYIVEYEDHEIVGNPSSPQNIIIRMELLRPLTDVLRSKSLSREEVVKLGIDICKALEFCHKDNILHCDVKPSNIYLTKWGGYKLGDFSASSSTRGEPRDPEHIGTLKYMAPEVYAGEWFSASIDTYSLGLVMYELLQRTEKSVFYGRLSGTPLPPISNIDQPLQSIIFKACAYNPEDRFSSATEMLSELLKLK